MNETQRNIKRYKAALPGLRERIAATAMLLVVSLSMMISASFAWYTISTSPEVSMMATTVASNGNLEIALAHGLVKEYREEPAEVALGQSTATPGQTLVGANITWGNLVNLSDDSYGLGQISLRPAKLSDTTPSRTPLYGVDYTVDGRIEEASEYYRYASWNEKIESFDAGETVIYGVRAISSMTMSSATVDSEISTMAAEARKSFNTTVEAYNAIIKSKADEEGTHMNALIKLLEKYVNDKAKEEISSLNNDKFTTPANYGPNVEALYKLVVDYQKVLEKESDTICQLANMHIFSKSGSKEDFIENGAAIRGEKRSDLKKLGVPDSLLNVLDANVKDYNSIQSAIDGIRDNLLDIADTETVYWNYQYKKYALGETAEDTPKLYLETYITKLVSIGNTYVGSSDSNLANLSQLGTQAALDLLNADPIIVKIGDAKGGGVLKNTEERIGPHLRINDQKNENIGTRVQIELKTGMKAMGVVSVDGLKNAAVRTCACSEGEIPTLTKELNQAELLKPEPTDLVSKDIYGFAIDLWARTNAQDTVLTLEGITLYDYAPATCSNPSGGTSYVLIATGKIPGETEGETVEDVLEVYVLREDVPVLDADGNPQKDKDGNPVMTTVNNVYDASTHIYIGVQEEMASPEGGEYKFTTKWDKVYTGYDGVNRVWQEMIDGGVVPENGTTQGAGSCYVFYASPSEQPRILEMLRSFTIAFLNEDGDLMATAKLNTEEAFEINGKVTVPLKVVSGVSYVDMVTVMDPDNGVESEEAVDKFGIMKLPRGEASWLTAIVYLDGEEIGNENVLAAGSIEGRLNLQFGSSVDINSQKNEPLLQKYRTITAVVVGNDTTDDGSTENPAIEFTYDNTAKTVTAKLTILGDQPQNVSGFFTRMVGQNQGTRMETKSFGPGENPGEWVATFDLTKPGVYRLNSVVADGTEYVLEKKPGVWIKGQAIKYINCTPERGTVMTSDDYYDVPVRVDIGADPALQPEQVRVLFTYGDNKEATAILSYDGDETWTGTLRVTESGSYTMAYLVMDGNTDKLSGEQQKSFYVRLGLKAEIECTDIWDKDGVRVDNESEDQGTYSILYKPQGGDEGYDVRMEVRLTDGDDKEVGRMNGLQLFYQMAGTTAMSSDLLWIEDAEGGYYLAEMTFKNAGGYEFSHLKYTYSEMAAGSTDLYTNESTITNATSATNIAAVPPDPPKLTEAPNKTVSYQYVPNPTAENYAFMSVEVYDSSAAVVEAKIVNQGTGEYEWVPGVRVSTTELNPVDDESPKTLERYTFKVPKNPDNKDTRAYENSTYAENCMGTHDGIWVLEELRMQQVTDEDRVYYPGPNGQYREFNMTSYSIETEVVQTVFDHVQYSNSTNAYTGAVFGLDENGKPAGAFMQSYTVDGVKVKINKWNGQAVNGISNVKLNVNHEKASTEKYGGYTIESNIETDPKWSWKDSNQITYNADTLTLPYAGEYNVDLVYQVGDNLPTTLSNKLAYKVYTVEPTMTVSEVTPNTADMPTRIRWKDNYTTTPWGSTTFTYVSYVLDDPKTNDIATDENGTIKVTAYAQASTTENKSLGINTGDAGFILPTLKFAVTGIDGASTVKFTIAKGDADKAIDVSIAGSNDKETVESDAYTLGKYGAHDHEKATRVITYTTLYYKGHVKQTITKITIERKDANNNTVIFTVTLNNPIEITNPSSQNQSQ